MVARGLKVINGPRSTNLVSRTNVNRRWRMKGQLV